MADREVIEFLRGVEGMVEANGFERMCLYQNETQRGTTWKEELSGIGVTIGHVEDFPVHLSLLVSVVNGRRLLFFHATSRMVDHTLVDNWLKTKLPSVPKVDAMNFHNVLPHAALTSTKRAWTAW